MELVIPPVDPLIIPPIPVPSMPPEPLPPVPVRSPAPPDAEPGEFPVPGVPPVPAPLPGILPLPVPLLPFIPPLPLPPLASLVQVIEMLALSSQVPSLAVTVKVVMPTASQVNVDVADRVLVMATAPRVPTSVYWRHLKVKPSPSRSAPVACRLITPFAAAVTGIAAAAVIAGQLSKVPLMLTVPVLRVSLHCMLTAASEVLPPVTSTSIDPAHVTVPSLVLASSCTSYFLPAGIPRTVTLAVIDLLTSICRVKGEIPFPDTR